MSEDRELYARVHEILGNAEGLTGSDLDAFLVAQCGDDHALRSQVEELLAAGSEEGASDVFSEASMARSRQALERAVDGDAASWLPDQIGGYDIVRQIGQGGMGIVYEAMQHSPRRSVAIKLLHPIHATADRMRRFRRETELLGRLQHPGIAQIFEASTYDIGRGAQPFFAMELVDGVDIGTHCEQHRLDHRARIQLLADVADAVQYAHDRGVIHRDLKPDNVLVNERGQPRILDFGVARTTADTAAPSSLLTEKGQLIGTLAYMAPEQLYQSGDALTTQVDVYGLGVLAFELLTHKLPRDVGGLPVSEAMRRIADTDAERAGALDPSLAGEIETILGKALEADLDRRYASAADFARDLRRFLASEPIEARPPSRIYLARKFARRNRALVSGAVATLLVAIALSYANDATNRAAQLERVLYRSAIGAAGIAVQTRDLDAAELHLDTAPAGHRGWEYDYLRARLVSYAAEWETPATLVSAPVFDRDGRQMLAVMADATIGTWDIATGRLVRTVALDASVGILSCVRLHGATRRFAARSTNGELLLGEMDSGEARELSFGAVDLMRWSPNGNQLLFCSDKVRIWDGEQCRIISETVVAYGAWSPSGDRVVLANRSDITLHDAATGELLGRGAVEDMVQDVAFAPDGLRIAVACFYRNVFVLDGESLAVTAQLAGHEDLVWQALWTEQGQLVTTSNDLTVRVWSGEPPVAPDVYLAGVQDEVWRPTSGDPVPDGRAKAATMPGDSGILVVGDRIRVLPLGDPAVLKGHDTYVYHLAFSPDGSMLASSAFRQSEVRVWDVNQGTLHRKLAASAMPPSNADAPLIAFSADGRRLVTFMGNDSYVWDVDSCAALSRRSISENVREALYEELGGRRVELFFPAGSAISADGMVAARARGNVVEVSRRTTATLPDVWGLGDPLVAGSEILCQLVGHTGRVFSVAFSPDGSRIATGSNDTTVCVWDAHTGERLLVLSGHEQYVMTVAWSPDGRLLASASGDTTVRLWDSLPLHERRAIERR